MSSIKYVLLFLLLLSNPVKAQSNVFGLGKYIIGATTPDSLERTDFNEQDPAYVKGTLTLPCTHIRIFKAGSVDIGGILIENLSLCFYDSKLFKLSCDYSNELKKAFLVQYGKGISTPTSRFSVCSSDKNKRLVVWGESWQNADIVALALHRKGYNSNCEMEEKIILTITSQQMAAFASDCDLATPDSFIEEFDKVFNDWQKVNKLK